MKLILRLKQHWRRYLLELLIVALAVAALRTWQQWNLAEGQAPAFAGQSLAGAPLALADYRGRPLLLHFWATWCPICRWEHAGIAALAEDYAVLGVAMQSGDTSEVQAHLARADGRFTVLNDPDGALSRRYGVRSVPTTFILDAEGKIRFREVGYSSAWGLRLRLWWLSL